MNLIIEQGNSSVKVAVFNGGDIVFTDAMAAVDKPVLKRLFAEYNPVNGIFSSVTTTDESVTGFLNENLVNFILFTHETPVPVSIGYETPHTLGLDRLAAVVGATFLQPGKNLLVIDAGTAITYDLVEASGFYPGGNISPGMATRFKALNYFTQRLPLVAEEENVARIGTDTKSAIRAGVIQGIVYEMDGYINDLRIEYPELLVFLTGGHSFYFERRLKNRIFADANLVLAGLNRILQYNVEN